MGRTPFDSDLVSERLRQEQNRFGLVMWMAGGDVRPRATFGQTDEFSLRSAGEEVPGCGTCIATLLRLMVPDQYQLPLLAYGPFQTDDGQRGTRHPGNPGIAGRCVFR